jgi:Ca-activated chloride channel family protein|tara:strand:- start:5066 stop:6046 length:981 start_codon:yes stop_codon:yes gene_type:complete
MNFLHPLFFWLLLLIPILIVFYFFKGKNQFSSILFTIPTKMSFGIKAKLYPLLFIFRLLTIIFLVFALARPQSTEVSSDTLKKEGIDIMIAMDISSSMLAEDFKPNRLESAKELAIEFINRRKNDRIGLVTYASVSFTQCPLTTDHDILINMMNKVKTGILTDGTAIGVGLSNCINRLKDSKADSKIIILLTDGENNSGVIDPISAANIARKYNIKTYTIGVGSYGTAPYPGEDVFGRPTYYNVPSNIDEDMLTLVADTTGGVYFRADKKSKLAQIYEEIELLEKTEIEEIKYYNVTEKYFVFCLIAFLLFIIELLLDYTIFRKVV